MTTPRSTTGFTGEVSRTDRDARASGDVGRSRRTDVPVHHVAWSVCVAESGDVR